MIRLRSAGKTDVGLKREENEDNFIMLPDHGLYVLADGMGGHVGGKMASTLAVTLITEFIAVRAVKPDFQFEYPIDESLPFEANVLANAVKYASERIFIESCKDRAMEGMGTTVTAILATDEDFVLAHVGDSRIYRLRDGKLTQMTVDHSLLNHMIEIGEIKPEDSHKFANKNVILRAVGLKDYVDVSVRVVPKRVGDSYLMCSDGLSDLVEDDVIAEVLRTAESLPVACNQLIQLALRAGGKDNITTVCIAAENCPEGEEHGWGTGTFTRKQLEAATAAGRAPVSGSGGGGNAGAVQRPRSPAPSSAPRSAGRPMAPGMAQRPQSGMVRPPEPSSPGQPRLNGQRLHAVRRPVERRVPAGDDFAPPVRQNNGMPAPPPPRGAAGMMPAAPPRRRGRSTPPAPIEPVAAAEAPGGYDPSQSAFRQALSHVGQPGADSSLSRGPGSGSGSDAAAALGRAPRRRTTPTDVPAYSPPGDAGFSPSPSGSFAAPDADGPPSSGSNARKRPSSGIFQAPPPGVFPPSPGPGRPPGGGAPIPTGRPLSADAPPAPGGSRDTVEDVPVIARPDEDETATNRHDTVRDIPIITRSGVAPAVPSDSEIGDIDDADPEENRPTTLIPRITRDQVSAESKAHAKTDSRPALGRPQAGEGHVTIDETDYRDEGSIMIDNSLFTETQDEEESIVIDDSLLMEFDEGDEEDVTQKGPPPPPGSPAARDLDKRPTELLPITGARRKNQ